MLWTVLGALCFGVGPRRAVASETEGTAAAYARLDEYVLAQLERGRIPGAALVVVEGDRIAHLAAYGSSGPSGAPITPQTPFCVGSISKSFTALAALQLVEQGRLDLDAHVQRYLPGFELARHGGAARITVRHLLTHTSGLGTRSGRRPEADEQPLAQAVRGLAAFKLVAPPGERFEYSNANYQVLGAIIEAVSATSFADYVERRLFEPLGLRHAHTGGAPAVADHLATGHRYWFGWPVAEERVPNPIGALPSGGLMLGAEDLGRYLIALLGGGTIGPSRVLSAASLELAFQPQVRTPAGGQYAFGWNVKASNEPFGVWHTGSTSSFHAHVALDRASRRGFALLLNAESHVSGPAIGRLGVEVGRALSGETPVAIRPPGIPLALSGVMLFVALQVLLCVRGVILLSRPRRAGAAPAATSWRHLLVPLLLAAALAVSALFVVPYVNDLNWLGLAHAAPDVGGLLLAVAVLAVLAAVLRSIAWLQARARQPRARGSAPDGELEMS